MSMTKEQKKYVENKTGNSLLFGAFLGGTLSFFPFVFTVDFTAKAMEGSVPTIIIALWVIWSTIQCVIVTVAFAYCTYRITSKRMRRLFGGDEPNGTQSN